MSLRRIVQIGDNILRTRSHEVTEFNAQLGRLIDDMRETMLDAQGVGLAAPQVGVPKRVFVVGTQPDMIYEFVNPVIVKSTGSESREEGCLSVPGVAGIVKRPRRLVIEAQDRYGAQFEFQCSGYLARAICHEIDHLNGVLFVDIMTPLPPLEGRNE